MHHGTTAFLAVGLSLTKQIWRYSAKFLLVVLDCPKPGLPVPIRLSAFWIPVYRGSAVGLCTTVFTETFTARCCINGSSFLALILYLSIMALASLGIKGFIQSCIKCKQDSITATYRTVFPNSFHNIPIARGSFGASWSLVPSWWPTPGRFGMSRPNRLLADSDFSKGHCMHRFSLKPVNPVNAEVLEFLGASLCWLRCLESGYLPGGMGSGMVQAVQEISIPDMDNWNIQIVPNVSKCIISRCGSCGTLFSAP